MARVPIDSSELVACEVTNSKAQRGRRSAGFDV